MLLGSRSILRTDRVKELGRGGRVYEAKCMVNSPLSSCSDRVSI